MICINNRRHHFELVMLNPMKQHIDGIEEIIRRCSSEDALSEKDIKGMLKILSLYLGELNLDSDKLKITF